MNELKPVMKYTLFSLLLQENKEADCVRVCVRCRPLNDKEKTQGCIQVVNVSRNIMIRKQH